VIYPNYVYLVGGGSTTVVGEWDSYYTAGEDCHQWDDGTGWCVDPVCDEEPTPAGGATSVSVLGVGISGPQAVQDGSFIDPTFTLTPQGGTPTGYQWSWSAPPGVGDNPLVTFNPTNAATTVTNRHWFANPDVACPSPPAVSNPPVATDPYYNSIYGITGQATFSSGFTAHADTTLTINAFWNPAGETPPPSITGGPTIDFDTNSNLWVVVNSGTIARIAPVPTIHVPINSQFYNKTLIHENRHVQQYVSGMNSDLFTVDSLMAVLSPLTDPTQAGLRAKIMQAFNEWLSGQNAAVIIRSSVMEADAYSVSDNVLPQYAYQNCGRF